ncbi:hypothetical protein TcasGA2_TC034486 [Tribolium castaneum]|uniref:Uncharacterized protein n=1 Tax=Tribolium castaneum TaxID=7070 RepID=A0A139WC63_TRICA|nr:hypothetical protein TcasGA2_TC034486 [Tribolium castaneum]
MFVSFPVRLCRFSPLKSNRIKKKRNLIAFPFFDFMNMHIYIANERTS